jgi:hypothetical protein
VHFRIPQTVEAAPSGVVARRVIHAATLRSAPVAAGMAIAMCFVEAISSCPISLE